MIREIIAFKSHGYIAPASKKEFQLIVHFAVDSGYNSHPVIFKSN